MRKTSLVLPRRPQDTEKREEMPAALIREMAKIRAKWHRSGNKVKIRMKKKKP